MNTSNTDEEILRRRSVQARVGLPISTIYRLAAAGKFPKPVKLSERASGWLRSEVDQWISDRAAERTEQSAEAA